MKFSCFRFCAIAIASLLATGAQADTLTYDFDSNLDAVYNAPAGTFSPAAGGTWSLGDWFGQINNSQDVPFSVVDASAGSFPTDTAGVVSESKMDNYFAATDTENSMNAGTIAATWTFNVTGLTDLSFSVDMGAMGDFEDPEDQFAWTFSIDGSAAAPLFAMTIDEDGDATYTLDGGAMVTLDDPIQVDGVDLLNGLTTFTSGANLGTGSSLVVTFSTLTNGGTEAIAFDNLVVTGTSTAIPEPSSIAILAAFGLIAVRRRR